MKKILVILLAVIALLPMFAIPAQASAYRPLIVIQSVETKPFPVEPGKEFELEVSIKNEGNQSARWVTLSLTSIEGIEGLGSFSVLNHDNIIHLGRIDKDEEAQGVFPMITAGDIKPGIYNLNFSVKYANHRGIEYETSHVTGIIVTDKNALSLFNINVPTEAELNDEIIIEGEFANLGKHDVESVMIRISGDIDISPSEYFVGTMAAGDVDMFSSKALVKTSGEIDIKIEASYTDSMNQRASMAVNKRILVSEPEQHMEDQDTSQQDKGGFFSSIGRFLKRLFGLG